MTFLDSALSAGSRIGRYFSVVTLVPTSALVAYVYLLVRSGGGTDHLDLAAGLSAVTDTTFTDVAWLLAAAVLLSLISHPLQFPLTQLLEGYWGTSRLGIAATTGRVVAHRVRIMRLQHMDQQARQAWLGQDDKAVAYERLATVTDEANVRSFLTSEAAAKALEDYPVDARRTMPTRLGNVLRRHEDLVGTQYGLRAITVYPHLTHVADKSRSEQAFDEAEQMDLALRLCLSAAVATALTLVLLARTGLWVFLAVVPYTAAYLAYRGACAAAASWMQSIQVMVDLDRFALYDALHVPRPWTHAQESGQTGPDVCDMLEGLPDGPLEYEVYDSPAVPASPGTPAAGQTAESIPSTTSGAS
jgi:hypothetical protein